MKKNNALLASALLLMPFVGCRTPRPAWEPAANIGTLNRKGDKLCLQSQNPSLRPGTQVWIVTLTPPQTAISSRVQTADEACQGYRIDAGPETQLPAIGVVNYDGNFSKERENISADLLRDGHPEYFRACASSEGIHYTIWQDRPLAGKRLWHSYQYLGYDVEPDCTPAELSAK
jgi:hypothetical protein